MTKEEIKKLNDYFNNIFIELEKNDFFLLDNFEAIAMFTQNYCNFSSELKLEEKNKTNNLTFEDVYLLAREIIEKIDKNYLQDYDNLIKSGELDFDFNNEYDDSHCTYLVKKKQKLIDINREFNYNDVDTLVHEFIHYTNVASSVSVNRYLLTEFLSIYFELYATNYLINVKKVPKDELNYNWRFNNIRNHGNQLLDFSIPFFIYNKIGDIDSKNLEIFEQNYFKTSKENYEKECLRLLKILNNIEKRYKISIKYEMNYDESELAYRQCELFNVNYRYILGGILAFYAFENCDMEKIIYLNNHINDYDFEKMSIVDVLNFIGIDINDLINNSNFEYITDILRKWDKEVVK